MSHMKELFTHLNRRLKLLLIISLFCSSLKGDGTDCNGHGTHCAGLAGGATYGSANGATLHNGRVLNCFGSGVWSDLISGNG